MATFVSQLELSLRVSPPITSSVAATPPTSQSQSLAKQSLRSLYVERPPPATLQDARDYLADIQKLDAEAGALTRTADEEEVSLRRAILGKLVLGLYLQALNVFLQEASDADSELEWWADLGRSRLNVAYYLVQTLPGRLINLSQTILVTLRSQNIPLRPSSLTPSSLRKLFPSRNILRPNTLTIALFPHLRHEPYTLSLHSAQSFHIPPLSSQSLRADAKSVVSAFLGSLRNAFRDVFAILTFPLDLVHNEVRFKRTELERVRNERAEILGALADLRVQLASALKDESSEEGLTKLAYFATQLHHIVRGDFDAASQSITISSPNQGIVQPLYALAYTTLPAHISSHNAHLNTRGLVRPSRITLVWPKLVFLPPLALYLVKTAYASRANLDEMAREAVETVRGFWEARLLGPLKDIAKTVRTTDEDGVIVTRQSVQADLDSLERMTLSLAREKLNYTAEQLGELAKQIRMGDLTPVMQIYEEDIRSPLKSALGGTLLRTLFVQIQKAKVDIDMALSGIDKLLKSQELTFAFVGVAPALAIVYALGSYVRVLWVGGKGSGRYGGKRRRTRVWLTMRRIERLLISQPKSRYQRSPVAIAPITATAVPSSALSPSSPSSDVPVDQAPPLTSGLLLISVTHLRSYAATYLPPNSRLREGFLEDIEDLEKPDLGRGDKIRVIERMWRNWGDVLGWRTMTASNS